MPVFFQSTKMIGQWFGSVGRAVATDTRGPRFKSSHWRKFKKNICLLFVNFIEKTKIKIKRPGMAHLKISENDFDVSSI